MSNHFLLVLVELFTLRYHDKYSQKDLFLVRDFVINWLKREDVFFNYPYINLNDFVSLSPEEYKIVSHFVKYVDRFVKK